MSSEASNPIDRIYGSADLTARVLSALERAGADLEHLSREDLSLFDEFHAGGLDATREMAEFAGIKRGCKVLDVGSGVGGPARTLAAEWNCSVVGIDVTASFCDVARELNRRVGMSDRVEVVCADAVEMPLDEEQFDIAWAQFSLPSIEQQAALFRQIKRVLKPNGTFVFDTLCAGPGGPIHLPVFWANSEAANHIRDPSSMRAELEAAGLEEVSFEDRTEAVLESARRRLAQSRENDDENALWLGLIVPDRAIDKMQNSILNNEQQRTCVMRGLFRRND